jgi:hypothetical protein
MLFMHILRISRLITCRDQISIIIDIALEIFNNKGVLLIRGMDKSVIGKYIRMSIIVLI